MWSAPEASRQALLETGEAKSPTQNVEGGKIRFQIGKIGKGEEACADRVLQSRVQRGLHGVVVQRNGLNARWARCIELLVVLEACEFLDGE